jgi:hypothetical protein
VHVRLEGEEAMARAITLTAEARSSWERTQRVLRVRGDTIFGVAGPEPAQHRRTLSTRAPFGTVLSHPVVVEVASHPAPMGAPRRAWDVEVRADGQRRRFPTFTGTLALGPLGRDETYVELLGSYEVPLGLAGRLLDRLAGRRIVERSLTGFLGDVAGAIVASPEPPPEAEPRHAAVPRQEGRGEREDDPGAPTELYLG